MKTICLQTRINAPLEQVFDASRSLDLHMETMQASRERIVAGKRSGLCEKGDRFTWQAWHFGLPFRMEMEIGEMQPYLYFEDHMVWGPFASIRHEHAFQFHDHTTTMTDTFSFSAPFGVLGRWAESWFLESYMRNLLLTRNAWLKNHLESR
jgi:ligand-binding SRPBCC domain-containing protein